MLHIHLHIASYFCRRDSLGALEVRICNNKCTWFMPNILRSAIHVHSRHASGWSIMNWMLRCACLFIIYMYIHEIILVKWQFRSFRQNAMNTNVLKVLNNAYTRILLCNHNQYFFKQNDNNYFISCKNVRWFSLIYTIIPIVFELIACLFDITGYF